MSLKWRLGDGVAICKIETNTAVPIQLRIGTVCGAKCLVERSFDCLGSIGVNFDSSPSVAKDFENIFAISHLRDSESYEWVARAQT